MRNSLLVYVFIIVTCFAIKCSEEGFREYLSLYSFKYGESLDSYVESRLSVFIANCKKFEYHRMKGDELDITALFDWNDDDLNKLSDMSVHYSGVASTYDVIEALQNEYSLEREKYDYCKNSLRDYSRVDSVCSTSWATAIIDMVNGITGKKFSAEQLIQCLPDYEEINGCIGVHPKLLATYLSEVGLVQESDFVNCNSPKVNTTYHFSPIYPELPNAGGLMNLIIEGKPVFAMVSLDLTRLRFVKDMSEKEIPIKCGSYEPSLYGIITKYKYDEEMMENSYWELTSHIIPCEEIIVRFPMSNDMTNGNYGGVAAYAFTLEIANIEVPTEVPTIAPTVAPTQPVTEKPTEPPTVIPTTLPPTTLPPTTLPPTTLPPTTLPPTTLPPLCSAGNLVISTNSDCSLINESFWDTITVNERMCTSITGDLLISNNPCLTRITFNKQVFTNLNALTITNNPLLESIEVVSGKRSTAPFFYTKQLFISNLTLLTSLNFGDDSFFYTKEVEFFELSSLESVNFGSESFYFLENLSLDDLPVLTTITMADNSLNSAYTFSLSNLPVFSTIMIGSNSLYYTTSFSLTYLPELTVISVGKYGLFKLPEVSLSNLPKLTTLIAGSLSFYNCKSFNLTNLPSFSTLNVDESGFYSVQNLFLKELPQFTTFTVQKSGFYNTVKLSISDLPMFTTFSTNYTSFWKTDSLILTDLPQLTSVTLGENAFLFATIVNITNLPKLTTLQLAPSAAIRATTVILSDLPELTSLSLANNDFRNAKVLTMTRISVYYK